MAKETKRAGHVLLSVLIALIATALITFGLLHLSASASLSSKNMHALAENVDVEEYLDKPTLVKLINNIIYRWTKASPSSSIYATEDTLSNFYDETRVRTFIGDVYNAIARSMKTGKELTLPTDDVLPLAEPLRQYVSGKIGREITGEECAEEIGKAINLKAAYPEIPHVVRLGLGIGALAFAAVLLIVLLLLRRENPSMGFLHAALAFALPALVMLIGSKGVESSWYSISNFPVDKWIEVFRKSIRVTGILCLIPVVICLILMVVLMFTYTAKPAKKTVVKQEESNDDLWY